MTEIANPTLEAIEQLVKRALWDVLLEAQLAALYASTPWLAVWPLRQITGGLARMVGDEIFDGLKLMLDLEAIQFLNDAHQKEFNRAAVKLKLIARDHGIDSEEFWEARENAKIKLSQFVRYGAVH